MPISFEEADYIFKAEKRLLSPIRWKSSPKNNAPTEQRRVLERRIEIPGGARRGTFFRITVYAGSLDRVTFQLDCDRDAGRTRDVLYRLDLNPARPHTNKPYGTDEVNGLFIDAGITHEHTFYDSCRQDGSLRMRSDEQARVVTEALPDYFAALRYACARINVINADDIPNPGDQGQLL